MNAVSYCLSDRIFVNCSRDQLQFLRTSVPSDMVWLPHSGMLTSDVHQRALIYQLCLYDWVSCNSSFLIIASCFRPLHNQLRSNEDVLLSMQQFVPESSLLLWCLAEKLMSFSKKYIQLLAYWLTCSLIAATRFIHVQSERLFRSCLRACRCESHIRWRARVRDGGLISYKGSDFILDSIISSSTSSLNRLGWCSWINVWRSSESTRAKQLVLQYEAR